MSFMVGVRMVASFSSIIIQLKKDREHCAMGARIQPRFPKEVVCLHR